MIVVITSTQIFMIWAKGSKVSPQLITIDTWGHEEKWLKAPSNTSSHCGSSRSSMTAQSKQEVGGGPRWNAVVSPFTQPSAVQYLWAPAHSRNMYIFLGQTPEDTNPKWVNYTRGQEASGKGWWGYRQERQLRRDFWRGEDISCEVGESRRDLGKARQVVKTEGKGVGGCLVPPEKSYWQWTPVTWCDHEDDIYM